MVVSLTLPAVWIPINREFANFWIINHHFAMSTLLVYVLGNQKMVKTSWTIHNNIFSFEWVVYKS